MVKKSLHNTYFDHADGILEFYFTNIIVLLIIL